MTWTSSSSPKTENNSQNQKTNEFFIDINDSLYSTIVKEPKNGIVNDKEFTDNSAKKLTETIKKINALNSDKYLQTLIEIFKIKKGDISYNDISRIWCFALSKGNIELLKKIIEIVLDPSNTFLSLRIKDEMLFEFIFGIINFKNFEHILMLLDYFFERVSFSGDDFIIENYYKHFSKLYRVELFETLHNLIFDKTSFSRKYQNTIYIEGTIKKQNGGKNSMENIDFTPEIGIDNIAVNKGIKDNVICENDIVLIEDSFDNSQFLGIVNSIDFSQKTLRIRKFKKYNEEELNKIDSDKNNSIWRVTKLLNYYVFDKTLQGLKEFCSIPNSSQEDNQHKKMEFEEWYIKVNNGTKFEKIYTIDQDIRNIIINSFNQTETIEELQRVANAIIYVKPSFFSASNKALCQSQIEALKKALFSRVTLIQGPPGTGKTTTCVEIVREYLNLHEYLDQEKKILVTADSNCAVDVIKTELIREGISVYRHSFQEFLSSDYRSIKAQIQSVKVICATCVGSISEILKPFSFPFVIIDEVSQSTEITCLLPLIRSCEQLVLIGDHKQLPPTVLSYKAKKFGLDKSLFERLIDFGITPITLNRQFRMHSSLIQFSSEEFYDGKIQSEINDEQRKKILGISWPSPYHNLGFIDLKGNEILINNSFTNPLEATLIYGVIENVINAKEHLDIGIITPYDAQKTILLEELGKKFDLEEKNISIDTVDGFQGKEKDLIIVSIVRSNEAGEIGFVGDFRRINVMLTRAKRGLIVIGNKDSMISSPIWKKWIEFIEKKNLIIADVKGNLNFS